MSDPPAHRHQRGWGDVIGPLILQQLFAADGVESFLRAGDRAAQGLIGPHERVEQFLYILLGLIGVHGQLLLDHIPFLADLDGVKGGIQKRVRQHFPNLLKMAVARLGIEASVFFAGEGVEIPADALDGLRDVPRGAPPGPLEQEMFNEMRNAVQTRRLVTPPDSNPNADADAGHMRHFRCGHANPFSRRVTLYIEHSTRIHPRPRGVASGGPTRRM